MKFFQIFKSTCILKTRQLSKQRQFNPSQVASSAMFHKLLCTRNLNKAALPFVINDETKIRSEYLMFASEALFATFMCFRCQRWSKILCFTFYITARFAISKLWPYIMTYFLSRRKKIFILIKLWWLQKLAVHFYSLILLCFLMKLNGSL